MSAHPRVSGQSLSAEERAANTVAFMGRYDGKLAPLLGNYAISIIASAIRDAENAAYERAAVEITKVAAANKGKFGGGFIFALGAAAEACRLLKSQEPA